MPIRSAQPSTHRRTRRHHRRHAGKALHSHKAKVGSHPKAKHVAKPAVAAKPKPSLRLHAESTFEPAKPRAMPTPATTLSNTGGVGEVPKIAPETMSEAEKFDHYAQIVKDAKGTVSTKPGVKTLCGIRIPTDPSIKSGKYDDVLAMMWTDKAGQKHVREYRFNTEPTPMFSGGEGVDVNRDGRKDLARLPAGTYGYVIGKSDTYGDVLRPVARQMVDRDVDADGFFDDGIKSSAGQSILFHGGMTESPGNKGAVTLSAGCQTLPPDDLKALMRDLRLDGGTGRVSYTLVHGEQ